MRPCTDTCSGERFMTYIGGVASGPPEPVYRVHIQPDVKLTESLSFGNPICRCVVHNSVLKHWSGDRMFQRNCLRGSVGSVALDVSRNDTILITGPYHCTSFTTPVTRPERRAAQEQHSSNLRRLAIVRRQSHIIVMSTQQPKTRAR